MTSLERTREIVAYTRGQWLRHHRACTELRWAGSGAIPVLKKERRKWAILFAEAWKHMEVLENG